MAEASGSYRRRWTDPRDQRGYEVWIPSSRPAAGAVRASRGPIVCFRKKGDDRVLLAPAEGVERLDALEENELMDLLDEARKR